MAVLKVRTWGVADIETIYEIEVDDATAQEIQENNEAFLDAMVMGEVREISRRIDSVSNEDDQQVLSVEVADAAPDSVLASGR